MKALLSALIFMLLLAATSLAGIDNEIWKEANNAYDQNNFELAIKDYRKLLEHGSRYPAVYYNLGNAYFKNNKLGLAIAAYRHCLKLDPSFKQAEQNLEFARRYTVDKVEPAPRGFWLNIWYGLAGLLSAKAFFIFSVIVYWALSLVIALMISGRGKKEFLTYLLILLSIMLIFGGAMTRFVINEKVNAKWGVVTAASAELREGPGQDFEKLFTGHEGLELKVLSQRQGYYLVELANGLKGWIKEDALTEI